MDFEEIWEKTLEETEILRYRIKQLSVTSETKVNYYLLSESTVTKGDTVVRKGEINVMKPSLLLPPNNPQFLGFDLDEDEEEFKMDNNFINFLLIRGVSLPSLKYNNETNCINIFEGELSKAIDHYQKSFQKKEDVKTGLIVGPSSYWQLSLLVFICSQMSKNAEQDIKNLIKQYKNNSEE